MVFIQTAAVFSPLVQLSGAWNSSSPLQNWAASRSVAQGDSMKFSFNGSAATIYGSTDGTGSVFSIKVDENEPITVSNQAVSTSSTSVPPVLYTLNALSSDPHTVLITNQRPQALSGTGNGTVSVSAIDWTMDIEGTAQDTVDDAGTTSSLVWTPSIADWSTFCNNDYYKVTCHLTYTSSASVTYTFVGSAISVFGGVNNDHGSYTVQIDGGSPMFYSGFSPDLHIKQLLAHSTVSPGLQHTITITNGGVGGLDIDYFEVFGTDSKPAGSQSALSSSATSPNYITGTANMPYPTNIQNNQPGKNSNLGPILGATLGAVAGLAIVVIIIVLWRRRRSGSAKSQDRLSLTSGTQPEMASSSPYLIHPNQPPAWPSQYATPGQSSDFQSQAGDFSHLRPTLYGAPASTSYSESISATPVREEVDMGRFAEPGNETVIPPAYRKIDFSKQSA